MRTGESPVIDPIICDTRQVSQISQNVPYICALYPILGYMATHSSVLSWRIPWTEEPGRVQFMGLQELDMTEPLNHHHSSNNKGWDDKGHLRQISLRAGMAKEHAACDCVSESKYVQLATRCTAVHVHFRWWRSERRSLVLKPSSEETEHKGKISSSFLYRGPTANSV